MMTEFLQAVVFDMDDVLCDYRFSTRLGELSRMSGRPPEIVQEVIWDSGFDEEADRGGYSAESYLAEFNRRLGTELSAGQWLEARARSMVPDEAVLDIARAVGRRTTTALLTNNGPLLKQGMDRVFPQVLEIFGEHAYFAYEFGDAKPEPSVFRNLAERLGVPCQSMLFIDDTPEYIAGAAQAGVHGHLFRGAEGLQQELRQWQLL